LFHISAGNVFEAIFKVRNWFNQCNRQFTQPLRTIGTFVLLPNVVAIHDFDLVEIGRAKFLAITIGSLPPYFDLAATRGVGAARWRKRRFQMKGMCTRLVERTFLHRLTNSRNIIGGGEKRKADKQREQEDSEPIRHRMSFHLFASQTRSSA